MYKKIIFNIFLMILLIPLQLGFIASLPHPFNVSNLIIIIIIFIMALYDFKTTMFWAIGSGLLLDIYSFYPFGIYSVSLPLAAILADLLLINFFTDRSLYSLVVLNAIAYALFELFFYFGNYFLSFLLKYDLIDIFNSGFWLEKSAGLIINSIIVLVIFYTLNFFSKKFKPAILAKYKA